MKASIFIVLLMSLTIISSNCARVKLVGGAKNDLFVFCGLYCVGVLDSNQATVFELVDRQDGFYSLTFPRPKNYFNDIPCLTTKNGGFLVDNYLDLGWCLDDKALWKNENNQVFNKAKYSIWWQGEKNRVGATTAWGCVIFDKKPSSWECRWKFQYV